MEPSASERFRFRVALSFAERHFTDPGVECVDAAAFVGVHLRLLTRALHACGTTWQDIMRDLKFANARELLRTTDYESWVIARMCGMYDATGFAIAFRAHHGLGPAEYRRAGGGSGNVRSTTAIQCDRKPFYRPGAPREAPVLVTSNVPLPTGAAVRQLWEFEAKQRISDRRLLETGRSYGSILAGELEEEVEVPRYLREDASYWRAKRACAGTRRRLAPSRYDAGERT